MEFAVCCFCTLILFESVDWISVCAWITTQNDYIHKIFLYTLHATPHRAACARRRNCKFAKNFCWSGCIHLNCGTLPYRTCTMHKNHFKNDNRKTIKHICREREREVIELLRAKNQLHAISSSNVNSFACTQWWNKINLTETHFHISYTAYNYASAVGFRTFLFASSFVSIFFKFSAHFGIKLNFGWRLETNYHGERFNFAINKQFFEDNIQVGSYLFIPSIVY